MTREIAAEMLRMEGFIGVSFFRIRNRGVTISAWEKPEQTQQPMRGGTHSGAMRKFRAGLSDAVFSSVWASDRINALWVRCTACRKMNDHEKGSDVYSCGQTLPEAPPYFQVVASRDRTGHSSGGASTASAALRTSAAPACRSTQVR